MTTTQQIIVLKIHRCKNCGTSHQFTMNTNDRYMTCVECKKEQNPSIKTELREQKNDVIKTLLTRLQLRERTQNSYGEKILLFCQINGIDNPHDLKNMLLEEIEIKTESHIMRRLEQDAPKSLNSFYCAMKAWVFALRLLKTRKSFMEISFDKSSRKFDAMNEKPLELKHLQTIFKIADLDEKILMFFYSICGLRPSLISKVA